MSADPYPVMAAFTSEGVWVAAGSPCSAARRSAIGDYTVDYRAFTAGAPALGDLATVRVRVVGDETNGSPWRTGPMAIAPAERCTAL